MTLSSDKQMLLCHRLLPLLDGRRVGDLMSSIMASVRRELTVAGFEVAGAEMSLAHMGMGSCCRAIREAGADVREGSDATGPTTYVCARLMVDVGDDDDTAMSLSLQFRAWGPGKGEFFTTYTTRENLNLQGVIALDAHLVLYGALNRMLKGEAVEGAIAADLARDFCGQFTDALVP